VRKDRAKREAQKGKVSMTTYRWEQAHEPMTVDVREGLLQMRRVLLVLAWLPNRRRKAAPIGFDGLANELDIRCGNRDIEEFTKSSLEEFLPTLETYRQICNEAMAYPASQWIEEMRQSWEDDLLPESATFFNVKWMEDQAASIVNTIEEDLQQAFGDGHTLSL
jgi:hypothetical protein